MEKIEAVIFDLDGTLVNSIEDIGNSVNHALVAYGLSQLKPELFSEIVGWGLEFLVQRAVELVNGDGSLVLEVTRLAIEFYEKNPVEKTFIYPGILELVQAIKSSGRQLGVLTNKRACIARRVVHTLFGEGYFEVIYGEEPGKPRKPQPEAAWELCAQLGVPPNQCLMVGDSKVDVQLAHAAGMPVVGVSWGFRGVEELHQAQAIVQDPQEIIKLLN